LALRGDGAGQVGRGVGRQQAGVALGIRPAGDRDAAFGRTRVVERAAGPYVIVSCLRQVHRRRLAGGKQAVANDMASGRQDAPVRRAAGAGGQVQVGRAGGVQFVHAIRAPGYGIDRHRLAVADVRDRRPGQEQQAEVAADAPSRL
jgi:hypothetical protein